METPVLDVNRRSARLAAIRENISTRLWFVNGGMSSLDFNALMDQMASLQLDFEGRDCTELRMLDSQIIHPDRSVAAWMRPGRNTRSTKRLDDIVG